MEKQKFFDKTFEIPSEFREDFCFWNDQNVVFIKNDVQDGKDMWLLYAADGTKLATTDNRDFAFLVARQNNLEPKSVH